MLSKAETQRKGVRGTDWSGGEKRRWCRKRRCVVVEVGVGPEPGRDGSAGIGKWGRRTRRLPNAAVRWCECVLNKRTSGDGLHRQPTTYVSKLLVGSVVVEMHDATNLPMRFASPGATEQV